MPSFSYRPGVKRWGTQRAKTFDMPSTLVNVISSCPVDAHPRCNPTRWQSSIFHRHLKATINVFRCGRRPDLGSFSTVCHAWIQQPSVWQWHTKGYLPLRSGPFMDFRWRHLMTGRYSIFSISSKCSFTSTSCQNKKKKNVNRGQILTCVSHTFVCEAQCFSFSVHRKRQIVWNILRVQIPKSFNLWECNSQLTFRS